jgi:hypothetical protein
MDLVHLSGGLLVNSINFKLINFVKTVLEKNANPGTFTILRNFKMANCAILFQSGELRNIISNGELRSIISKWRIPQYYFKWRIVQY